ncbi:MAG TPA: metallophosphoesterase [Gemmatimonadaceae bacterium]|nr:metallophosphoesterase [Gemmatimonadaceae bacterium]
MSDSPEPARPRRSPFAQRFLAYQVAAWSALLALTIGHPWATVATLALIVYVTAPIVLLVRWRGWPFYPGAAFRILVVRVTLYVQLLLPIVAGAALLGILVGLFFHAPLTGGRWAAGVALAIAVGFLLAGYVGSRWLSIRAFDVTIPDLPAGLDGLRIVQISDLHVGPHISRGFLAKVRRATERFEPELIAVTGDLIDDRSEDVALYANALGTLAAPLGVFAIAGNHDVYAGWEEVERELKARTSSIVLVNEARVVERNGVSLAVVGVGDPAGQGRQWRGGEVPRVAPDVARAMRGVPAGMPVLALAHNPALWPRLAARGVMLTLSGHTHWGQFAIPAADWSLASLFLPHPMGIYREGTSLLYVHPGTGYWGIPFRIGARPQVAMLVLRAGAEPAITPLT